MTNWLKLKRLHEKMVFQINLTAYLFMNIKISAIVNEETYSLNLAVWSIFHNFIKELYMHYNITLSDSPADKIKISCS